MSRNMPPKPLHYNIMICDDNPASVKRLLQLLKATVRVKAQVYEFSSRAELAEALQTGLHADIALMDIELGEENGIQAAKELFPPEAQTQIIFVTGYMKYCTSVYNTDHIYFLLKPVQEAEFQNAIEKAITNLSHLPETCLTLYTKKQILRIPFSSIRYLESTARRVTVYCQDQVLSAYTTLDDLESQLPDHFVRCHQSFCINMNCVKKMEAFQFLLDQQECIPISQSRRLSTRDKFMKYLRQSL